MNINKELDELLNDPMFEVSNTEETLFELTEAMKRAKEERKSADYVAQRRPCENFADYEEGFRQVHKDLREGRRMLKKFTAKAMQEGHYYVASGVLVYLEKIINPEKPQKGHIAVDGRTRTIYENGMESDIKLHTLSKNVYTDGYIVTDSTNEDATAIEKAFEVTEKDVSDGWIYVLSSLSENPEIAQVKDLYKIGFSTTPVEERIRNCEYEPTYLMDKVKIVATWKTFNMNTHSFETLIHQFFKAVQFHVKVKDLAGREAEPQEWFVVPLGIISKAIESIIDGSIVNYRYNPTLQVIEEVEKQNRIQEGEFDTTGWKILTLNIKQLAFNQILQGEKTIEYRDLKPSTMNRFTWVEAATGNRYLRKFDALRLCVGRTAWSDRMLVEVVDTTFDNDAQRVEYHLGKVLQVDVKKG
jgi:hypothetical protein